VSQNVLINIIKKPSLNVGNTFILEQLFIIALIKKKQACHAKCWSTKRCFTVFKTKDCGHCKHCTVPVVKCVRGHKCAKECLWVHFRDCFFKKLPDFLVKKCSKIFVDKKFKECVTGCIHIVKTKQCWDKCVKHRIDKEHSKCERVLVRKGKKI